MARASRLGFPTVGARNLGLKSLTFKQKILDQPPDGRQLCEPKFGVHMCYCVQCAT